MGRLVDEVRREAGAKREAVGTLVAAVRDRATRYGASMVERVRTSESAQALLATLQAATDAELVQALASASIETSEAAVGRAMAQAQPVAQALNNAKWSIFDSMRNLQDHRQAAAVSILSRLAEVLGSDEHVIALKARLEEIERDAVGLLTMAAPTPPLPPTQPVPPLPPQPQPPVISPVPWPVIPDPAPFTGNGTSPSATEVVEENEKMDLGTLEAATLLKDLQERLQDDPALELSLSWRLARRSTQP